ncbi:synaptotagmin-1-like [Bolinopsis microptera]|uniref:synaptotagmin-1-like n=1 Tax=Bolinopsis microptera TaxID=2820187 RepID=UPI00307AA83F
MSLSLSDELTVLLCVLGVIIFIFFVFMVFLCFECLRQKENQPEGGDNLRFSWLSFLSVNQKGDNGERLGNKSIFNFSKNKEQPPAAVPTETYVLNDSIKSSYVDIVPQSKGIYKSIAQDSDSESQFSFTSEPDQRRFSHFAPLEASTCGTIVCSIKFYHFANRLAVRVGEVQLNLVDNLVVNPYVKLHLLPEYKRGNRQTTRVKRNSTLFVCDEDFLFGVGSREVRTKSLSLQVYDYKSNTRHMCIGKVNINLGDYDFKDEDKPLSLKRHIIPYRESQEQFGALQVACSVTSETLRIGIVKGEGLVPVDMSGTLEPYCRIMVHIGSELVHKKKTCIAEAINRSPVWEEYYTLDLPAKTLLCDISITIEIRDHLRNSRSTSYLLMGRVTLSNSTPGHGQTQWEHVCSQRGTMVTEWQPILP